MRTRALLAIVMLATIPAGARAAWLDDERTVANPDVAIETFDKACSDGRSPECRKLVEFFLLDGHLTHPPQRPTDRMRALTVFEKMCARKRVRAADEVPVEMLACRRVGEMYALGQGTRMSWPRSAPFLEKASTSGDAVASMRLARLREAQNQTRAAQELNVRACAQTSFLSAQQQLGEPKIESYRKVVALACERSTAPPMAPAPTTTACGSSPQRRASAAIQYPLDALLDHVYSGQVLVELTVGVDGRASNVHVLEGRSPFIEEAVTVLETAEYEPATCDGTPVAVTIRTPIDFKTDAPKAQAMDDAHSSHDGPLRPEPFHVP